MKRNLIKTTLCLLLAVLMIAALSACGDSGTETNTSTHLKQKPKPNCGQTRRRSPSG